MFVHRDLAARNVLVANEGTCKVGFMMLDMIMMMMMMMMMIMMMMMMMMMIMMMMMMMMMMIVLFVYRLVTLEWQEI